MTFLKGLQWPSVVLLVAVLAAIVVCAALGVSNEAIAIVGAVGTILQAFAPALGRKDTDVLPLVLLAVVLAPLLSGCGGGTTQRATATGACSTLLVAIGEAEGVEPARAEADRQIVHEVCVRYVGRGLDGGGGT